jgi:hypothetical protein
VWGFKREGRSAGRSNHIGAALFVLAGVVRTGLAALKGT